MPKPRRREAARPVKLSSKAMLARLGRGDSIASVAAAAGLERREFDAWWGRETAARVPAVRGTHRVPDVHAEIHRDAWGIPHVQAPTDRELFFAFGYAMAQDRLFQLDYLRRKASGTLAEVLGEDGLALDIVARTVGLRRIAEAEWERLPTETRSLLEAFAKGINAVIEESAGRLPIEFDLLDYAPGAVVAGRQPRHRRGVPLLPHRALPGHRHPGAGQAHPGRGAALRGLPPGRGRRREHRAPRQLRDGPARDGSGRRRSAGRSAIPHEGQGSNNWVAGRPADSRAASPWSPAIRTSPSPRVSCWYEAHLSGGSFEVAGHRLRGHAGGDVRPHAAHRLGRHEQHLLPARPLPGAHRPGAPRRLPPRRRLGARPRAASRRSACAGAATVRKTIRFSRNGPIVDELLPSAARGTGPVALRWLGATECGWLTSLLAIEPREVGRRGAGRAPRLARADLEPRVRRRRRPHRLPGRRADPDPPRVGAGLSAGLGSAASVGRA